MNHDEDSLTEALVRAVYRDDWSLDRLLKFADKGFAATNDVFKSINPF